MAERKQRWPTVEEMLENAKRGIIDDRAAVIPPMELEDWEIRGEAEPKQAPAAQRDLARGRTGKAPAP